MFGDAGTLSALGEHGSPNLTAHTIAFIYGLIYNRVVWEVVVTNEFKEWYQALDEAKGDAVYGAVEMLQQVGPNLGRPHADRLHRSEIHNLKELRPRGEAKNVRILFVFDPLRQAILLVGGDKSGQWNDWYETAIPLAEKLYAQYLKEAKQ